MSAERSMRDLPQWVCWRYEERGGKRTKIPYSPSTGARARTDDSATWSTLNETREATHESGYNGIGFVFTEEDPFCGVDLDDCLDLETGEVKPWAMEIVKEIESYTEISPSGNGLHIIIRARLPEGRRRDGKIEMYDRGRFFTITGNRLPGTAHLVEDRQRRIDTLHARLFSAQDDRAPSTNGRATTGNVLEDEEILHRATRANNGDRFAALWSGDRTGYASGSEADLALCSMLAFWTGPDEDRIASLFSRSGLVRGKWDREDYRRRTIARAIKGAQFHSTSESGGIPSRHGDSGSWVSANRENLDLPPALPDAPQFPIDAMPAACRSLIQESEKALGCAPELVALPMLATLSSAIGTSRVIEIKGGWREWAALFMAVVASPGAMKTPAAKIAKKPAFERQRMLGKSYAEEKEEWKREVREWEVEKRDAQKAGEPAPEEPEAPTMSRSVASDTTVEALVSILEDNPRGLLIHKDELAGWVRSMDQYKGGKGSDRQHWLSFWSCDEVVVDRKSRMGEPLIVAKPFISLFGGIQPAMLGELGAGAEDGLMDRFLFAYPKVRRVRFTYEEVSAESEERYTTLYDKLADLVLATDEHGDPNPKPLKLSNEARRLFAERVDSLGAEMLQPGFPARLEGVWSKLRGHLARLSLVLAVCRCVESSVREERIEREDVEAASALLDYFASHARRVYEELSTPDPLDLLAADLRDLLEESGGRWEGSATDLHEALGERGAASLPDRPEELSKLALRIGERSPALQVSQGWRKIGGRKGNSKRVLKLALVRNIPENAVGPVVTVEPGAGNSPGDNGDYGNNGNSERSAAGGDNGTNGNNGNPPRERDGAEAAGASPRGAGDGRSRFTL